jgi:hypothetical protein
VNPIRGYQCASLGYLILLYIGPMALCFAGVTILTNGGVADLVSMTIALMAFSIFFQRAIVVEVNPAGVTEIFLFGVISRTTPWSDIQNLEGGRFRARLVRRGDGKMRTVAMFDPHWVDRKVVRAIRERLADSTKLTAQ